MFVLNRLSAKKSETSDSFEKMSQNRSFVSTRLRSKPSINQSKPQSNLYLCVKSKIAVI